MNKTLIASLLFGTCVTLASCDNNAASNNESATTNEVASTTYGVAFEDKGAITPDSMDAYVRSGKEFNGVVIHAASCANSQALTSPTFQAVTRSDSFTGLGKVPAFTFRHKVGELKGSGAAAPDRALP